jgi:hypothetical protein
VLLLQFGEPVKASASNHEIEARQALRAGETSAVYVVSSTVARSPRPCSASPSGSRPATLPRAVWRLGATVPYALLSGLGVAVIAYFEGMG